VGCRKIAVLLEKEARTRRVDEEKCPLRERSGKRRRCGTEERTSDRENEHLEHILFVDSMPRSKVCSSTLSALVSVFRYKSPAKGVARTVLRVPIQAMTDATTFYKNPT